MPETIFVLRVSSFATVSVLARISERSATNHINHCKKYISKTKVLTTKEYTGSLEGKQGAITA